VGELYGVLIFWGIVLIGVGIFTYKHPDILWKMSLSRRWYLKGGEPTELYYSSRRMGAVFYIIFGIIIIVVGIGGN